MFGRVLVAIANDEIAGEVLRTAAALAGTLESRVLVVNAIQPVPDIAAAIPEELLVERRHDGRAFLAVAAARFAPDRVETMLREGSPADEVVAASRAWDANLLIIGSHRRGGLARLVLGSTAEGILRHAPCPVLVVPNGTFRDRAS